MSYTHTPLCPYPCVYFHEDNICVHVHTNTHAHTHTYTHTHTHTHTHTPRNIPSCWFTHVMDAWTSMRTTFVYIHKHTHTTCTITLVAKPYNTHTHTETYHHAGSHTLIHVYLPWGYLHTHTHTHTQHALVQLLQNIMTVSNNDGTDTCIRMGRSVPWVLETDNLLHIHTIFAIKQLKRLLILFSLCVPIETDSMFLQSMLFPQYTFYWGWGGGGGGSNKYYY